MMGRSWALRSVDQIASSAIMLSSSRMAVCPERTILWRDAAGRGPTLKSWKAGPVCVPLPSQRTTTISRSAIRVPILLKQRSGKASRKAAIKCFTAICPRRELCIEYCKSTSGAASSSTTARSQDSPQNETNHRPTIALFNVSLSMKSCFPCWSSDSSFEPKPPMNNNAMRQQRAHSGSCSGMIRRLKPCKIHYFCTRSSSRQDQPVNACKMQKGPFLRRYVRQTGLHLSSPDEPGPEQRQSS
jgi:hypothetical protein